MMEDASQEMLREPLVESGTGGEVATGSASKTYRGVLECWGEVVKLLCCPFLCCQVGPMAIVEQGFTGVLTRFGVFERKLPPGLYVFNCMSQAIRTVNMKMQTIEVPRQAAMTKDNLSVNVDAVTFITVVEPGRAVFQVENYPYAVRILAASTLLRIIGEHDLKELFKDRARINGLLTQTMQDKTAGWGIQVAGVEMRDITIPEVMQRAMAQIAEANREADAKVIVADGQRRAASILAEAAAEMSREPMAIQLQWFETLRSISAEKNSTVIVPDSVVGPLSDFSHALRSGRIRGDCVSTGNGAASTSSGEAPFLVG
mmetsp:Transcript_80759/g.261844  ORF Transcript_80759/g.261844 Transcript_80759/m.261844 type:complete len:316 (-) Transcript_80759:177-1124(-)